MKKTPLYQIHKELGAKLVDFHGWKMPVQYKGIIEEHESVRNNCGLFDISHMGEIELSGKKSLEAVNNLVTNDVRKLEVGQIVYTPMCYQDGGIVDDLLVYKLGQETYLLVVNASNIEKDYEWIKENCSEFKGEVEINNLSENYAQLAVQGPESRNILSKITEIDLEKLKYYRFKEGKIDGINVLLSRTGYTGELGYEIYLKPEKAETVWNKIMEAGKKYNLQPVGLGARDTLRLEKKMLLYGNDINKETHPLEAGLGWTVKFDKPDFIGKEALLNYRENGYSRKLVGFKLIGRGIARKGYQIEFNEQNIGKVTSGSFSPTLKENIGLGYVQKENSRIGTEFCIIIRGKKVKAEVVETPFV